MWSLQTNVLIKKREKSVLCDLISATQKTEKHASGASCVVQVLVYFWSNLQVCKYDRLILWEMLFFAFLLRVIWLIYKDWL